MKSVTRDPHDPLRLLLVDDDRRFGIPLKEMTSSEGYPSEWVPHVNDALLKCREHDAIVTDLVMPDKSGFDLILEVRRIHPSKWIIVVTGHEELKPRVEKLGSEIQGFYGKLLLDGNRASFLRKLQELQGSKWEFGESMAGLYQLLSIAKESDQSLLDRHRSFLDAKKFVRGQLWMYLGGHSKERQQAVMMLRVAMESLSFIPSEKYHLTVPGSEQIAVLLESAVLLGMPYISEANLRALDRQLRSVGLDIGPEFEETSHFECDAEP